MHVCENIGKGEVSKAVNDLHGLWEGWVNYENPECDIMDAELVYFMINYCQNFKKVLFCVNLSKSVF